MEPARTNGLRAGGLSVAIAMLCLATLTGCNTGDESDGLKAMKRPHIDDVSVPDGFKLVDKRSRSYSNQAGLRWVDYLYKGREDKFEVLRFYQKRMAPNRWSPQMQQTAQGQTTLDFAKDNERCRITVSGGGTLRATYIHISIAPGANVGFPAKRRKR